MTKKLGRAQFCINADKKNIEISSAYKIDNKKKAGPAQFSIELGVYEFRNLGFF